MLVGEPAWVGRDLVSIALRKLADPPPDPWVYEPALPEALANIVLRCMATRREDRYANADEVAAALRGSHSSVLVERRPTPPAGVLVTLPPRVERGCRTVAVLPFQNTGTSSDDYLAEELTDDLIDSLSMARGLEVRPRRMITPELVAMSDLDALGRALNVQVIVEGSVRRREGAVRVSARALSVADGLQLWAKRFDRPARELLTINDEVAHAVVEALAGQRDAVARSPPTDPEAVDLLVRARQALRHAWMGHASLDEAVGLFEAGLRLAPKDPALLSGYAMALARVLNYSSVLADDADLRGREAATRAIEIAPHLGESWLALATIHYATSDWVGAVAALRAALGRVPSLQKAHEMLASIEFEIGELDSAMTRARGVLALDPSSDVARADLSRVLALLGRFDEGRAIGEGHMDHPQSRIAYWVVAVRSDFWRGSVHRDDIPADVAANPRVMQHIMAFREATERRRISAQLVADWEREAVIARLGSRYRPLMWQFLAELHAHVGDKPRALAALDRAVAARLHDRVWLERCPALACVRDEPAFTSLYAQVAARADAIRAALVSQHTVTDPRR
jgi:eukaryotic-like serine/threonine-protein kinase